MKPIKAIILFICIALIFGIVGKMLGQIYTALLYEGSLKDLSIPIGVLAGIAIAILLGLCFFKDNLFKDDL